MVANIKYSVFPIFYCSNIGEIIVTANRKRERKYFGFFKYSPFKVGINL